jgi:glycosyltransferase involved in cell wall biosynthesis
MKTIFQQRGLPAEKFMVLPNGVDPETFHPHVDGNEVRKTQRLAGKFVVGFVGWIRPWHGIDILLDTIALLEKRIPDLHLLLVGDGPAVPELQAQTQRLGLMEKVHFTGPVPKQKIPSYIAAMDIAVQPDVTDYASPIKLFEYLAMGKAVIAPRKDNIVEIVEHEKHALLYKARDTKELADRIEQLYIDRELRKRLGLAAYQLVQEKGLYWRANASRVVEVIEKARKGQSFV